MRHISLVLALAFAGCATRSVSVDEYEAVCHEIACDRAISCGSVATREQCDLPNVIRCPLDPRYVDAVHDGRIAWDSEAAATCLDTSRDIGCDWTSEAYRGRACDFTRGLLAEGASCMLSSECISNECFNEFCTEACCAGTCVGTIEPHPGAIGEQCRTTYCAEGYCDGSYCVPFLDEGAACETHGECAYGLACSNRACRVLPDRGEPCEPTLGTDECRTIGDRCSSITHRCEDTNFTGTMCFGDDDCAPMYACEGNQCVFSRAELGEACDYDYDCATPGAICSVFDGCMLPRPAGEPCRLYNECESDICNYETGICATLDGCL